jgi:two-component system cell cycle response regulator CpdR
MMLVVDDDDLLRSTIARQLEEAGYTVLAAGTAEVALDLVAQVQITAFLLDVTMPGTSGPELAARICALVPGARIVLSGYDRVDLPSGLEARFLQKPFTEEELLRSIDRGAGLRNN